MNRLAIFYHTFLGPNPELTSRIINEQMTAIEQSGLLDSVSEFHVCDAGDERQSLLVRALVGDRARFQSNSDVASGELPTLGRLQDWLPAHPDWSVLYLHTKGASKPLDAYRTVWRRCMMRSVVWNWRTCSDALEHGSDMAGAHWLTNEKYPDKQGIPTPIWGGNFWWARADYLLRLPPLIRRNEPSMGLDRMVAENWIGFGPPARVADLAPHWPTFESCSWSGQLYERS